MDKQMERLYRAAKELKGITSQAGLARALNTSSQVIKNWEGRGISQEGKLKAQRLIGCSATWLETGTGDMAMSGIQQKDPLTDVKKMASDILEQMTPEERATWLKVGHAITKQAGQADSDCG